MISQCTVPALTLERFPQSSNGPRGTVSRDFYTQFFFAKLWACAPADGMLSIFEYGFDFAEILVSKVTYNTFSVSVVSMTHRLSLAQRCQKKRSKIFYDTLSLSLYRDCLCFVTLTLCVILTLFSRKYIDTCPFHLILYSGA